MICKITTKFAVMLLGSVGSVSANVAYNAYVHPDVSGWATGQLRAEVFRLTSIAEPTTAQWPALQRQEWIVRELTRRFDRQIAVWQAEDAVAASAQELNHVRDSR